MKSKSFDIIHDISGNDKHRSASCAGRIKTAAATSSINEKYNVTESGNKENGFKHKSTKKGKVKHYLNKSKNNKRDMGNTDSYALDNTQSTSFTFNDSKITSTPTSSNKIEDRSHNIKSIMKKSSIHAEDSIDNVSTSESSDSIKRKKRNKSVSFMLYENDEVIVKKSKSDDDVTDSSSALFCLNEPSSPYNTGDKLTRKNKKNKKLYKANKNNENVINQGVPDEQGNTVLNVNADDLKLYKHKKKKYNKAKEVFNKELDLKKTIISNAAVAIDKTEGKSNTKKKRNRKLILNTAIMERSEGEPQPKTRKKDIKGIAENLENLSIGDNAFTLTNLLDEMTVIDKNKKKKIQRNKVHKTVSPSSSESAELEKIKEDIEKVKWKKRKWNKDTKGEVSIDEILTSVIVENIPLKIMMTYRKLLTDHFTKFGPIKKIGVAEVYPTEDPKPVFTTTVHFYSEEAATQALQEDKIELEGGHLCVKRPLPATQTTVVVRSYGILSEQTLCSAFTGCGRIRTIKHIVKGRSSISTAFVVFDGPDSVERAIKIADDAKIGGRRMFVSRFEVRSRHKHTSQQEHIMSRERVD